MAVNTRVARRCHRLERRGVLRHRLGIPARGEGLVAALAQLVGARGLGRLGRLLRATLARLFELSLHLLLRTAHLLALCLLRAPPVLLLVNVLRARRVLPAVAPIRLALE